jgi:hypothetical protein
MKEAQLKTLKKLTLESWIAVGESLGLSSSQATDIASRELDGALKDADAEIGGMLSDSPLGTKWVKGKDPSDKTEEHFMKVIQACSVNYDAENVRAENIMWFWDLSTVERFIEIRSINVVRMALFFHGIENGGSFGSIEEATAYSAGIVHKFTPSFDMCHPSFYKQEKGHPLPYELISEVSSWYLTELAKSGFKGLEKIVGKSSTVNEEARRLRKLGKI